MGRIAKVEAVASPKTMSSDSSDSSGTAADAISGTDLASRVVISLVACALVTWQLLETMNFKPDATWLATSKDRWFAKMGGTPLQWFLVLLMLLSALDGFFGVLIDIHFFYARGESHKTAKMTEELGMMLVLGKLSQMILSLMIVGLGANGWRNSAPGTPARAYAQAASALGALSLFVHRLPAPLVLVGGVFFLQRTPTRRRRRHEDDEDGHDDDDRPNLCAECFSLSCMLRPLLMLAIVESMYAGVVVNDSFRQRLEKGKHDVHAMMEQQKRRAEQMGASVSEREALDSQMAVFDSLNAESMIEMVQQGLGEVVQFGTVVALGLSGRCHGLKHTLWPVAAAMVPCLPTSFAVVFYFLLETRQTQAGGTILPLAGAA